MGEPISTKTLGGVTYNANQFTGRELGNGQFELKAKNGGETLIFGQQNQTEVKAGNGRAEYYRYSDGSISETGGNIWIKDHYENGEPMKKANPRIELNTDNNLMYDDNHFTISDMMGATFKSSKETVAHVKLENSEDTTINLAANQSKWYGDDAKIEGGKNNTVILDAEDSARINGKAVKGEGTADQKDYE